MSVVSRARAVRGAVALSAGLDPYEGVFERVAGAGRRADTETGAFDVAPVSPGVLGGGLDAIAGWRVELVLFGERGGKEGTYRYR